MSSITAAIAVLNVRRRPMSCVILAQRLVHLAAHVALRRRRARAGSSGSAGAPPCTCVCTAFHRRFMKRNAPSTPSSLHSSVCSGGAANIMNRRAVSAPYCSTSACGSTPLFFDFDIVPMPALSTGRPSARSTRADARALVVDLHVDVGRVEVLDAAFGGLAEVDLVEHHALRQQVRERLLDLR